MNLTRSRRWRQRDAAPPRQRRSAQATYTAPEDDSLADTSDEEYAKLTPYGQNQVVAARAARKLRKLEVRSADLRNEKDCNGVVFGADAVVHCAASLKPNGDKSRGAAVPRSRRSRLTVGARDDDRHPVERRLLALLGLEADRLPLGHRFFEVRCLLAEEFSFRE